MMKYFPVANSRVVPALLVGATIGLSACNEPIDEAESANAIVAPTDNAVLATIDKGDYVTIGGKVASITPTSFLLDYGNDNVTVEMKGWNFYQGGGALKPGDNVIVTGRVDRNFMNAKAINGGSLYVERLGSYFYPPKAGGTDFAPAPGSFIAKAATGINYSGWVTSIDGPTFTMGANDTKVTVDTSRMADNPLDKDGFQQVNVGDRVYVWGDWKFQSDGKTRLLADGVVSLTEDQKPQAGSQAGMR